MKHIHKTAWHVRHQNPVPIKKTGLYSFIISLCLIPAFVYAESVPAFSDQDLQRYRKKSDISETSADTDSGRSLSGDKSFPREEGRKPLKHEVAYTAFEGGARRVIIPVQLNDSVAAQMVLDTGSPGMIIFDRLAKRLGIFDRDDAKLLTSAAGIGGNAPSVLTIIDAVQVGRAEDKFIPTNIVASLSDSFDGVIGMDFMANYTIRIDTARRMVVFEELPDRETLPGGHDETWWRGNFRNFASRRAEWKQFTASLNTQKLTPERIAALKQFADRQYREADRLFTKLNNYAITNSVPMHWRQY
ncbi:MAG: clan AA aspartic protease [Nitrospirae bacterium]|nr:clan AA aspartic protease [Nitrospirota bacterium]